MCPICMATTALIVAGSGSTCGLLTVAVKKIRGGKKVKNGDAMKNEEVRAAHAR